MPSLSHGDSQSAVGRGGHTPGNALDTRARKAKGIQMMVVVMMATNVYCTFNSVLSVLSSLVSHVLIEFLRTTARGRYHW